MIDLSSMYPLKIGKMNNNYQTKYMYQISCTNIIRLLDCTDYSSVNLVQNVHIVLTQSVLVNLLEIVIANLCNDLRQEMLD